MGFPSPPLPVKLFVGMLACDRALFDQCLAVLSKDYGPVDRQSPVIEWTHSRYYEPEMGERLLRTFICFERLFDPSVLAAVKHRTNEIELSLAIRSADRIARRINLDPGYVTEAKVVLASTKDFSHRVYIGDMIYAETTLVYRRGRQGFAQVETTYPEFRAEACRVWFDDVRRDLHAALKRAAVQAGS